jgi:hypothetical protein
MEVWKDIPGYDGMYQVSTNGTIYSTRYKRYRKLMKDRYGYSVVGLNKNGSQHFFLVHRLVAESFLPNPEKKPEVNHIDGNKQNNQIENLEWATRDENMEHAYAVGLAKKGNVPQKPKKARYNRRFTVEQAEAIRGEYVKGICGYKLLARKYGVSSSIIKNIVLNRSYRKTS